MALPLPPGPTPSEVGFLCEMEMVTVIPRQRLEELELLGGRTPSLQPPHRAVLPLWLALLLKRQGRANIMSPPWLHPTSLESILQRETETSGNALSPATSLPGQAPGAENTSPPFVPSATADAPPDRLPYHWLEMGEILLDAASDDLVDPETIRRLMRDLREVRMAKIRAGVASIDPAGPISLNGAGGMEISESRSFITGVVDGLRKLRASREEARLREARENDNEEGDDLDDDDEMEL